MRILIVEDEIHNREALSEMLTRLGHQTLCAQDGVEALALVVKESIDLILCDVRMPRMDGLDFFKAQLKLMNHKIPFVFMTAYGRLNEGIEVMRLGALHFLTKPVRKKEIIEVLSEVESLSVNAKKQIFDSKEITESNLIWRSRAFFELIDLIERVASSQASVLLIGESGTGKEMLARHLHAKSVRANKPFIAFDSAAVPEGLIEAELFGVEKGAFTGAEHASLGLLRSADGGTFFIDELSSMPLSVQTRLLRVIQEKTVQPVGSTQSVACDLRFVSASSQALEPLIHEKRFREDLYYRLKVVVIEIPPLRERPEDIDALIEHFNLLFSNLNGRPKLAISEQVRQLLLTYCWPGNVRELRNVMERACVLAQNNDFTLDLLPKAIFDAARSDEIRIALGSTLESAQDELIRATLKRCGGDKNQAAQILGVNPRTIYRWIEKNADS